MRISIRQPLADGATDHTACALSILHAHRRAVVPTERELVHVALQVLLRDAVERAHDAALQDREEALGRLDTSAVLVPVVLASGVHNGRAGGEVLADGQSSEAVVRVERRPLVGVLSMTVRNVLAVTSATWVARTRPPRSTSAWTACFFGSGLPLWAFLALPPT